MALWNEPLCWTSTFRQSSWHGHEQIALPQSFEPGAGQLTVLRNGLLLIEGEDYEEVDEMHIRLKETPEDGDIIVVRILKP